MATFHGRLDSRRLIAFEFRYPACYDETIFATLRDAGAALCISDHVAAPAPWIATAAYVYVRGHGANGRYRGRYDDAVLDEWARRIRAWRREGHQVYAYFDNDEEGAAPLDAEALIAR